MLKRIWPTCCKMQRQMIRTRAKPDMMHYPLPLQASFPEEMLFVAHFFLAALRNGIRFWKISCHAFQIFAQNAISKQDDHDYFSLSYGPQSYIIYIIIHTYSLFKLSNDFQFFREFRLPFPRPWLLGPWHPWLLSSAAFNGTSGIASCEKNVFLSCLIIACDWYLWNNWFWLACCTRKKNTHWNIALSSNISLEISTMNTNRRVPHGVTGWTDADVTVSLRAANLFQLFHSAKNQKMLSPMVWKAYQLWKSTSNAKLEHSTGYLLQIWLNRVCHWPLTPCCGLGGETAKSPAPRWALSGGDGLSYIGNPWEPSNPRIVNVRYGGFHKRGYPNMDGL